MDSFLTQLYEDEREKVASADLQRFMDTLSVDQLADMLGIKVAGVMSQERREDLPSSQFAVPESKAEKIGVEGEIEGEAKGKYPIPDEAHARNALARVSQFGSPAEREAVRSKVYAKYPGLKEGFEERHGESPTSEENVKKETQGNVEKESGSGTKCASVMRLRSALRKMAGINGPDDIMPCGAGGRGLDHGKIRAERGAEARAESEKRVDEEAEKESGCGVKHASAGANWADQVGRFMAHEIFKTAQQEDEGQEVQAQGVGEEGGEGQKSEKKDVQNANMEKEDAFSTPEAQSKAKVLSRAMKMTKGLPATQRKAAISATASQMKKAAGIAGALKGLAGSQAFKKSIMSAGKAGPMASGFAGKGLAAAAAAQRAASPASRLASKVRSMARPAAQRASNLLQRI